MATIELKDLRGVQRLAGTILMQAIEDLDQTWGRPRENAILWIANTCEEQFSFNYCCRMLSRNPNQLREDLVGPTILIDCQCDGPRYD